VSTRGPSIKSTISNIESKNTKGDQAENGEKQAEPPSGSINVSQTPQNDSEVTQKDHINRSIEIQSGLPVRSLGRQNANEQKPEINPEQINNSPFNVIMNEKDYEDMSNEEVMEAVRQMATNAMAQAATKAATTEVLGRAVTSNQEQESEEIVLPIIEVTKPKLSVERQIQVHDEVVVEKEEPEIVEVVISNVQFDEQVLNDETDKIDLGLPDVFPGAEHVSSEFDISKLTRTMTMNSQKRLISAETLQTKAEEDSKSTPKKKKKKELHIKQSYRTPGCCVAFNRMLLTVLNFLVMIFGVALLVLGVMGQIKFHTAQMKTENVIMDPSFILLIAALISIVVSFNGGFGFFRGNLIMMRFFGWMLTAIFLCIFIGGIIVWAMADTIQGKVKQLYFHFIKMRVSNTGSSFFALETIEGYFRCCGVLSRADYTVQSLGWCDAKEIHLEKCAPPDSCCPSGLECDMNEAYEVGCVKKMAIWTSDNTPTLAGVWVLIWLVIVFEIVAVAHSVRRLNLQARWQKLYGHFEEEEKLKARIAKKTKGLDTN